MNQALFDSINAFARATPWLHPILSGYAEYGVILFGALLVTGWWIARRANSESRMAIVLCAGGATLLAVAINQPIVNLVREARPYVSHPDILVLAHRSSDFSFPSDHAVMAGAVATGLFLLSRRLGTVAIAAALLLAFTRVYIAAHYPVDVAVGLLIGAAVSLGCYSLAHQLLTRLLRMVGRTRMRSLLYAGNASAAPIAGHTDWAAR